MSFLKPSHHSFTFQYTGASAEITRTPFADNAKACLKNTSAVPETGGRHIRGHFTFFGPQS